MANEVLDLVNKYRLENGLSEVRYDATAELAANIRAEETEVLFEHTRPDGSSCFTALDELNASYMGVGENIAAGQRNADEVMTSWMNSPGHRENILNSGFTKIGVGYAPSGKYWTQMFIS
jgi:uncharacterized protein YkwD